MQASKSRDWLQLAGLAGVIAGLLLVAFEMRQTNRFAEAEAIRADYSGWDEILIAGFESDFYDVYAKSFENPESLSFAEIMRMEAWLSAIMQQYDRQVVMHELGLDPTDTVAMMLRGFDFYFGNQFGRTWFSENKDWLRPELVEAIEREIESRPVVSAPSIVDKSRSEISSKEP